MKWSEISIHTTEEAVEAVSYILHEAGASGVAIEDPAELTKEREQQYGEIYALNPDEYPAEGVLIKAYFPQTDSLHETIAGVKSSIDVLPSYDIEIGTGNITVNEVNEEDWATAWKKYYHPVQISDTFTIVPTWEEYTPSSPDEKIIELDPGMAFGTGTHPTTTMCIRALEKTVQPGDAIIDVGTGSGVLSIAAAKLGASSVQAYDLDPVAVESAEMNVRLNKTDDIVSVGQNSLLEGIEGPVDLIVANLLAEIILLFPEDAARVVKSGGLFITSGIIAAKEKVISEALEQAGFTIEEVLRMEDWVAIIARNA
ncbi:50S ribosomal protein L11 methyltransferase [Bacillus cereus]|uniref:50S ribosomal protein L11 methyltransferase n=1 Tax=Bacillus TaxID=1386 RepID=UPI000A38DB87|nr:MULTISPECIES: 50S ribosomal protein L11 methyltransferase [Bacillus cereus group]KAB2424910.1 50S ribosomal protein L11 methyltransferase [Bacillus cereus]KAB2456209.1 50S ribosomal protein L11 methyltransferase [Bacillus cereus]KAB2475771.1 50S ribosomal protein L11 methyltransferase [Bacillus cereus]OUA85214.1 ribosomal protein L11 methyltransferase [Bacillus thuringiensis serovar leesis]